MIAAETAGYLIAGAAVVCLVLTIMQPWLDKWHKIINSAHRSTPKVPRYEDTGPLSTADYEMIAKLHAPEEHIERLPLMTQVDIKRGLLALEEKNARVALVDNHRATLNRRAGREGDPTDTVHDRT